MCCFAGCHRLSKISKRVCTNVLLVTSPATGQSNTYTVWQAACAILNFVELLAELEYLILKGAIFIPVVGILGVFMTAFPEYHFAMFFRAVAFQKCHCKACFKYLPCHNCHCTTCFFKTPTRRRVML